VKFSPPSLAIAIAIGILGIVILSVGVNNLSKDCSEQVFSVVMVNEELGFLKATINGKEVIPENGGDLANGSTKAVITTWYNATDNTVMPHYHMDTWGLCVIGLMICAGAAATYSFTKPKRRYY
jgi:hypothetical protein